MRAAGPTAPKFGPKQTRSNKPRDVGIGGGPPRGGGLGPNRKDDTGVQSAEAATMGRGAKKGADSNTLREGTTAKHGAVVNQETLAATGKGAHVVGQNPKGAESPGLGGVGNYQPGGNRHGGHDGSTRAFGEHGRHHSTKGFEHHGHTHTSKDR
jgi:hypothetical protein